MGLARKILFYVFVALYAVLCPFLILYSFGYIFNPVKGELTQTGLIQISSIPKNAHVYLEASRYTQRTPATLDELQPGRYHLSLRSKGFRKWQHTVTLEQGKAVSFNNVLLIPDKWSEETLHAGPFDGLVPTRHGTHAFIVCTDEKLSDYFFYDILKPHLAPLVPEKSKFAGLSAGPFYMKKHSGLMIVSGGSSGEGRYILYDARDKEHLVKDVTALFSGEPLFVEWEKDDEDNIFAVYEGYADRINAEKNILQDKHINNIKGFGLYKGKLYFIDGEYHIVSASYDLTKKKDILKDGQLGGRLFHDKDMYQIEFVTDDIIIFMGIRGHLLMNKAPYNILDQGALGTQFINDRNILLYWTDNLIGIADFSTDAPDDTVLDHSVRIDTVYSEGTDIVQCFWAGDGTHIVFKDKDTVFVLEIEPQGGPHVSEVVPVKHGTDVFYSADTGAVYYVDGEKGALTKIEIIPNIKSVLEDIITIDTPTKSG